MQKTILITGCSSGIGKATAQLFAMKGWLVYACVRKEKDVALLRALGEGNIKPQFMDINDNASINTVGEKLQAELGDKGLDVLVNNAAISFAFPLEHASDEHIRQHFETNVFGTLAVTRSFLPLIKKARGRIVNISSGAGVMSTPLMGIYSATKFSIEALSDAFRPELKKAGVKVIIIEPGFINTEIHDKLEDSNAKLKSQLSENAWNYYQGAIEKSTATNATLRAKAPKAEMVANVIFKAVISNNPQARYAAGFDARLMRMIAPFLSAKARDKMWQIICGF